MWCADAVEKSETQCYIFDVIHAKLKVARRQTTNGMHTLLLLDEITDCNRISIPVRSKIRSSQQLMYRCVRVCVGMTLIMYSILLTLWPYVAYVWQTIGCELYMCHLHLLLCRAFKLIQLFEKHKMTKTVKNPLLGDSRSRPNFDCIAFSCIANLSSVWNTNTGSEHYIWSVNGNYFQFRLIKTHFMLLSVGACDANRKM